MVVQGGDEGERRTGYRIAIRHELFSEIKADRRLIRWALMFARRCERPD